MRTQESIISGTRTLRGIVHVPDSGTPKAVVCMFPGLDGTKVGPHRLLVQLSEALEAEGIASVRYDLTGQGDSDGRYADITRQVFMRDAESVLTSICEDERTQGLEIMTLGYSLGALVAVAAAGLRPQQITGVMMLSPILNYPQIRDRVVSKAETGGPVDYNGNLSYRQPADESWTVENIHESFRNVRAPMLMITGSNDQLVPREVYRSLLNGMLKDRCVHLDIEGAGHSFSHSAWTKVLIQVVCNFVNRRPLASSDVKIAPD